MSLNSPFPVSLNPPRLASTFYDDIKCTLSNYRFPLDKHSCRVRVRISEGINSGRGLKLEELCQLYTDHNIAFPDVASCVYFIRELYNRRIHELDLEEPAGWRVKMGINDEQELTEALNFEFGDPNDPYSGGIGNFTFRLERKSFTSFVVWIITPLILNSVSMFAMFYLW